MFLGSLKGVLSKYFFFKDVVVFPLGEEALWLFWESSEIHSILLPPSPIKKETQNIWVDVLKAFIYQKGIAFKCRIASEN